MPAPGQGLVDTKTWRSLGAGGIWWPPSVLCSGSIALFRSCWVGMESHPFTCKPYHGSKYTLLYGLNNLFSWRFLWDHWRMPPRQKSIFEWKREAGHFIFAIIVSIQPPDSPKSGPPMLHHHVPLFPTCDCVTGMSQTFPRAGELIFLLPVCCNIWHGEKEVIVLCDFTIPTITNSSCLAWSA